MAVGTWIVVGALLSSVGTVFLIARLWRVRDRPGAKWFLLTLGCQFVWCLAYGTSLLVADLATRFALEALIWGSIAGIAIYFLAFALAYTGRGALVATPSFRALLSIPLVAVLLAGTNPLHGLVWTDFAVVQVAGVAAATYDLHTWVLVSATGGAIVASLGSVVLFDTVVSYGRLYRIEAIAVGISIVPPLTGLLFWLYGLGPIPALNFAALLFVPHIALDAYAFVGSNMFEFHPATRREGERAAIQDLGNPVIVIDEADQIVTLNAAAEAVLGVEKERVLTTPLSAFLADEGFAGAAATDQVTIATGGQRRTYSLAATPLASGGDRLGWTIVLQDITEELQREQRLQVLNRVVRHNLRNDMTVVLGFAEAANENIADDEVTSLLDTVERKADALVDLGEKARTIERVLGSDPSETPVDLRTLLEEVVAEVDPPVAVAIDCPELTVTTDAETLRVLCVALVENAVEHGVPGGSASAADDTAPVRVSLALADDGLTITVEDDGPGIPDQEVAVLDAGEETDLEHSTGLGLWVASWATRRLGGDLTFETDAGTTVRVWLPVASGAGTR